MTYHCEPTGCNSATFHINGKRICEWTKTADGYEAVYGHRIYHFHFLRQAIQHALAVTEGWIV